MSEPIFGVDLGTTNSVLAVVEGGVPRVIPVEGSPLVPSVVSLDPDSGQFVVGTRARNRLVLEPEHTVASVKRSMGQREPLRLGRKELLPEEISAEILRYLKEQGSAAVGREVRRVVITVPAYFDDAQRRATIRAGELAGLEVVRIVNEPTAAALVYSRLEERGVSAAATETPVTTRAARADGWQRLLVYDLGGGTFDVSALVVDADLYQVRASCGDTHLGGDDFDQLLTDHLLEHLRARHRLDPSDDRRAMARLRRAAERAKVELSSQPYTWVMEEALVPGVDLRLEVSRDLLESLLHPLLDRTLDEVDRALTESRIQPSEVDRVLLVGGSTRIPKVQEMLGQKLQRPVEHSLDPDLCVALGAAVQGAVIQGETFDRVLVDVSAHSLGIKTADNVRASSLFLFSRPDADHFAAIIRRNTQIPVTRSEVFYTTVPGQRFVEVEVFQGESPSCQENSFIGAFEFELDPAPVKSPVVVELSYDLEGVIHVVVEQKGHDRREEVTLSTRSLPPTGGPQRDPDEVDNFLLRKARRLAEAVEDRDLAARLEARATELARLLRRHDASEAEVCRGEDELLELVEEAEDRELADEP